MRETIPFLRYKCFIFRQGAQINPLPQRDQRLTPHLHRRGTGFAMHRLMICKV
jgi:hypothetical protein